MFYPYFDTHCDTLLKIYNQKLSLCDDSLMLNLKNMSNYKYQVQVFALFNEGNMSESDMLAALRYFKNECSNHKSRISIKRTCEGIRQNFLRHRATAILAIEGLGNQTDFSLSSIDKYHMMGVRFMSLCWNGDNILCGGSDANRTGLTRLGRQALVRMQKRKIILDVSHMSEMSFWDAMEVYSMPLCATHSSSRSVYAHARNLTDEQFCAMAKRGGVCGINFYPPFLGGRDRGIARIISHIEYFMSLGGEDNIGIGADFDGIDSVPCGVENSALVCKLFDELLSLNYKESVVNKIAFYNFYNFYRKFEI